MKLRDLYESPEDPFGEWLKNKLKKKISDGGSRLKDVIGDKYNLDHVKYAIEKRVCLSNLGPTYLEQTISNLLRDMVTSNELPLGQLNDARAFFHLEQMNPARLKQEKKRKTA